jgi:hypothetical protein
MRFEVSISKPDKEHTRLRGFRRLEDAVAAALGIAAQCDEQAHVGIWWPKRAGRGECGELLDVVTRSYNDNFPTLLARCQKALAGFQKKRKEADARRVFIREVGFDAMDRVRTDKAVFAAFLANNFAPVREFLKPKEAQAA